MGTSSHTQPRTIALGFGYWTIAFACLFGAAFAIVGLGMAGKTSSNSAINFMYAVPGALYLICMFAMFRRVRRARRRDTLDTRADLIALGRQVFGVHLAITIVLLLLSQGAVEGPTIGPVITGCIGAVGFASLLYQSPAPASTPAP